MKKIPTLFNRVFEGHKIVKITPEVAEGLEWVLDDPGVIPTVKYDGSCCMIDDGGYMYRRYDAKPGRTAPDGAIPCQDKPDPITGHWPHWVPVLDPKADKWYMKAYINTKWPSIKDMCGTYEAVGPHFQGNPYGICKDVLVRHGSDHVMDLTMSFDGIKHWLETHKEEGIVFWYDGAPVCKIKRSDFGLPWPEKEGTQ